MLFHFHRPYTKSLIIASDCHVCGQSLRRHCDSSEGGREDMGRLWFHDAPTNLVYGCADCRSRFLFFGPPTEMFLCGLTIWIDDYHTGIVATPLLSGLRTTHRDEDQVEPPCTTEELFRLAEKLRLLA